MKIYIVIGECGEYDSHHTWNVKAFFYRSVAELYAKAAQKIADDIYKDYVDSDYDYKEYKNEYDLKAQEEYATYLPDETYKYHIEEVEFGEIT